MVFEQHTFRYNVSCFCGKKTEVSIEFTAINKNSSVDTQDWQLQSSMKTVEKKFSSVPKFEYALHLTNVDKMMNYAVKHEYKLISCYTNYPLTKMSNDYRNYNEACTMHTRHLLRP